MSKKHSRRIRHDDPCRPGKQAAQMIELLEMLIGTADDYFELVEVIGKLIERHFEDHQRFLSAIHRIQEKRKSELFALGQLKKQYRQYLADFEHIHGEVDAPSLAGLLNYSISLESLLEIFPVERVVEDFLDG